MKTGCAPWVRAIAAGVLISCLASCANNSSPVPATEYSTKILGHWQGTVGDLKEDMAINGDGTYVCQLYPRGFIANTLSQVVPGKISGTWNIIGDILTLKIKAAENELLTNRMTSSTIAAFKENELVLKSGGESSTFVRVRAL